MEEKKTGRIKEIKETVSGAVEILHQFRTPEVQESFGKLVNTATVAKEIIKELKTPEMVKNIENFRLITENINQISARMQNTLDRLEETGVISEAKGLMTTAKGTMESIGRNDKDLPQLGTAIKEMIGSIKDLADELKITIRASKNSGAAHSIREAIQDASEAYKISRSHKR